MSELKFTREDNKEYNTVSIKIENAHIQIKEDDDFIITNTEHTKYGYRKVTIRIINEDLKDKLKSWETEINDYLKSEVGTGPLTILYGNRVYGRFSTLLGQEQKTHHIKISGIWVSEKNKPFIQLWYVLHIE